MSKDNWKELREKEIHKVVGVILSEHIWDNFKSGYFMAEAFLKELKNYGFEIKKKEEK